MNANEILDMMRKNMGSVPAAIEKSVPVDPSLIQEHMRSKAFAMPQENPALDEATRTLIYLAAALAGTNRACVQAMSNRLVQMGVPAAKIIETVHITRLAMATKIIGDAEPVFEALARADK